MQQYYYTVFSRVLKITTEGVSLFTRDIRHFVDEKDALIEAIILNFLYIEKHDYFYDPEPIDQYQNNYFFHQTPQGVLLDYKLIWKNPQQMENFEQLYEKQLNVLYNILIIQKNIITPKCNKNSWLYSHKYTNLKRYNCIYLS